MQSIYRGWALFGVVLIGNVIALAALAVAARANFALCADAGQSRLSAGDARRLFSFVFPGNQASNN